MKRIMMMLLVLAVALWAEPSPAQVKSAVDSGNYVQAESLLKEVIKAHPESAKAHYMLAQVLAREGNYNQAKAELSQAKTLDPKMAFGSASAIASFESKLNTALHAPKSANKESSSKESDSGSSIWGWLFFGGIIGLIIWLAIRKRNTMNGASGSTPPPYGMQNGMNQSPYGGSTPPPYPSQGGYNNYPQGHSHYGHSSHHGSGMGSALMGGVAMGAGAVAGAALVNSLLDNDAHADTISSVSSAASDFGSFDTSGSDDWGSSDSSDSGESW